MEIFGGHYSVYYIKDHSQRTVGLQNYSILFSSKIPILRQLSRIVLTSLKMDSLLTCFYINSFHCLSFITKIICSRVKLLPQWKPFSPSATTGIVPVKGYLPEAFCPWVRFWLSGEVTWGLRLGRSIFSRFRSNSLSQVYFVVSGYLLLSFLKS